VASRCSFSLISASAGGGGGGAAVVGGLVGAGGVVVAGADDGVGVVAVVPVAVGEEDVAALPDVDEFADPLPSLHDVARSKAIAMTPGTAALSLTRATIPGPLAGSSAVRARRARSGTAAADEALLDDRRYEQSVAREHRSSRQPSSTG